MFFNKLVIENFGVYAGRQVVDLHAPSRLKPIILIGGLNGAGKTTLLDAIHLVLYGKRAQCSNRGVIAYKEFLSRCIHSRKEKKNYASIELEFTHLSDGKEFNILVQRYWAKTKNGIREILEVRRNGILDRFLTDTWEERVEEYIPLGIAHLFFFDGDKIEGLTDLENSADLISTAINSLLGLDLLDQLNIDLDILERKKKIKPKSKEDQDKIESLQERIKGITGQLDTLSQKKASLKNRMDKLLSELENIEDDFRRKGGEQFEKRSAFETKKTTLEYSLNQIEDSLREMAEGPAPLILVKRMIERIASIDQKEQDVCKAKALGEELEKRDKEILSILKKADSNVSRSALESFFAKDRKKRIRLLRTETYLNLSSECRMNINSLLNSTGDEILNKATKTVEEEKLLRSQLVETDRQLASVPDEAAIEVILKARNQKREDISRAGYRFDSLEKEYSALLGQKDQLEIKLTRTLEKAIGSDFEKEDANRIVIHSTRVRRTLKKFHKQVLRMHVKKIEAQVFESFNYLTHKESLVANLSIDPESLKLELLTKEGQVIPPNRLSAGERQLLATSILWGLARVSGRPLPTVIDTPLGRLDSFHRDNLVQKYFPHASHQVILLSTDEEINEAHLTSIKNRIERSYRLEYDETSRATTIVQGYFW